MVLKIQLHNVFIFNSMLPTHSDGTLTFIIRMAGAVVALQRSEAEKPLHKFVFPAQSDT